MSERSVTRCSNRGSGGDGLCVDAVIGIYGFALITSVASRVAFAISTARRNLCSPIRKRSDCACVSRMCIQTMHAEAIVTVNRQTAFWWSWRESNPRPNSLLHNRITTISVANGLEGHPARSGMSWGKLYRAGCPQGLFFFVATAHGTSPSVGGRTCATGTAYHNARLSCKDFCSEVISPAT